MAETVFVFPQLSEATQQLLESASKERLALAFDEITLEDLPSSLHPNDVSLGSYITRTIRLKSAGMMSAAMDTVTEARLALQLAKMGGIGIIHRNLSANEQAEQVTWVRKKIHFAGIIDKPSSFHVNDPVSKLQKEVATNEWHFTSFPIVDDEGRLVGLFTRDEMDFVEDDNPLLSTLMKKRETIVTAREDITAEQAYKLMKEKRVKKLPIVDKDDKLRGMYVWNDMKIDRSKRSSFSLDSEGHFLVGAAVGFAPSEMERVDLLIENGCKVLVLDSSHGACLQAREQLTRIRTKHGNKADIIVGNIASYDSAMYLLESEHKPDALKVGIGPGSICTTRSVTGHGIPQITAVYNVWKAVRDYGAKTGYYVPIIADGGIKTSGDVVKCFVAGASSVMLGSVFAGAEESPGMVVVKDGKRFKTIRGMGSRSAMEERAGSRTRYFRDKNKEKSEELSNQEKIKVVPEGVEGLVEFKGPLEKIVNIFLGGIQSGLAHSGAESINHFQSKARPWKQSFAGLAEGNPHSIHNVTY